LKNVARPGIEQQFNGMAGRLNAIQLKSLEPGIRADGKGLYLIVQESGSRSWILRTMVRGRCKEIGLGGLTTKSLADARTEAADLRSRAKKGEDVLEHRRIERRVVPTFKEAALTVHGNESENFKSDVHAVNWLRSLELYAFLTR
jgi:hypothetical protein